MRQSNKITRPLLSLLTGNKNQYYPVALLNSTLNVFFRGIQRLFWIESDNSELLKVVIPAPQPIETSHQQ